MKSQNYAEMKKMPKKFQPHPQIYSIYLNIEIYDIVILLYRAFLGTQEFYLPLLCNAPLELNAFSEDLVKLISPLAYGLVVAQIDVTKK